MRSRRRKITDHSREIIDTLWGNRSLRALCNFFFFANISVEQNTNILIYQNKCPYKLKKTDHRLTERKKAKNKVLHKIRQNWAKHMSC